MMCATASVQVCLDAGDDSDGPDGYRRRWGLLHAIGPVLVGAFANSPLPRGKPTGWVSSRQQVWAHMDPGRTRPPQLDGDPRAGWAAYALDAQVMCVRDPESADWSAPPRADVPRLGPRRPATTGPPATSCGGPPPSDLEYHLSTLFPPVRPRGHFELRMIDAQPGDGWIVPLAVSSALLSDAAGRRGGARRRGAALGRAASRLAARPRAPARRRDWAAPGRRRPVGARGALRGPLDPLIGQAEQGMLRRRQGSP